MSSLAQPLIVWSRANPAAGLACFILWACGRNMHWERSFSSEARILVDKPPAPKPVKYSLSSNDPFEHADDCECVFCSWHQHAFAKVER